MLETVDQIIEALGGTNKVAAALGVGPSAISNWKARGRIPSEQYFVIKSALHAGGKEPAPAIFGFAPAEAGSAA